MNFYKFGALVTDQPTQAGLIQLWAKISTDNNVCTPRLLTAAAGYQVTAGKTLYMLRWLENGTGNPGWNKFGYADNDVGFDTATARTNPVMALGIDDINTNGMHTNPDSYGAGVAHNVGPDYHNGLWKWAAASKFPFIRRNGAVPNQTFLFWCIEL
jgi:hypothetical protein